ncbi:MAG: hypothetical protein HQM08_27585 [Candidatus Riflebacteria bacterium]|nr:hypothetical protein [Candidatus Riflebacteria bacterium]
MEKELLISLSKLIEEPDEYFSHNGAMFFLGYLSHPPPLFTIVSKRRRRPRSFGETKIIFVYFPQKKIHHLQRLEYDEISLVVSSLEKTIFDICDYMEFSPNLKEIIDLVCKLPLNTDELISMSKFSDSALKRISFILSFTGKAVATRIPFMDMTRSPVLLDPRLKETEIAWDKRFYIRYPREIQKSPLACSPTEIDLALIEWMELRSFSPFQEFIFEKNFFPLRNDSDSDRFLNEFLRKYISEMPLNQMEYFLESQVDLFYEKQSIRLKRSIPIYFNRFLSKNFDLLINRKNEIKEFVLRNFLSNDLKRYENALYLASVLGMESELIDGLTKKGYELLNSGREKVLSAIIEGFITRSVNLPFLLYTILARIRSNSGNYEDAISILEVAKRKFEEEEDAFQALGEIAYASSNVYRMMHKFEHALSELFIARECYSQINDVRGLGMAETAMGNIFFAKGKPGEARLHYFKALNLMKEIGNLQAQAAILGNLGIIEYDCGIYLRANLFLNKAISLQRSLRNNWNLSNLLMTRGKTLMQMGYITRAFRVFKETYRLKQEINHNPGIFETAALLGWTCELLGQYAASKAWWAIVPEDEKLVSDPRIYFLIKTIKSQKIIFSGNYSESLRVYRDLMKIAKEKELPPLATESVNHGLLISYFGLKVKPDDDFEIPFQENQKIQSAYNLKILNKAILNILEDPLLNRESIASLLEEFIKNDAFDVFWPVYIGNLSKLEQPIAKKFCLHHFSRTPQPLINLYCSKIKGFSKIISGLSKEFKKSTFHLLGSNDSKEIRSEDYFRWQNSLFKGEEKIFFDGPSGKIVFKNFSKTIKPGSIPHKILSNLILAFPNQIEIGELFQSVWGINFDNECDPPAIKSSISRLRKTLGSVNPGLKIRAKGITSAKGKVVIRFPTKWEAVV